jgi:glucose dehydrogenase
LGHNGKQYVAVLSGVDGWAGIGLAAGLTEPTAGLGPVGGYAGLREYTSLGASPRDAPGVPPLASCPHAWH